MRKTAFLSVLVLLACVPAAFGQAAATRFINFVDTPVSVTFSASGQAMVPLDPSTGNVISLTGFRRVHVRVGSTTATQMMVNMGKISGSTLSQMFTRPIAQTQSFDVIGPQMVLWLTGGTPNTTARVQLWVYISS